MKSNNPESTERNIVAVYYRFKRKVRVIRYLHLSSACQRCFGSMEANRYEATSAEVIDLVSGKIYLTIYLTVDGNVHSFYGPGAKEAIQKHRRLLKKRKEDL